jgi:formate hydrogenlyase subunit 4
MRDRATRCARRRAIFAMTRQTEAQYRLRIWLLMSVYVALILFVWPYAKTAASLPLRALFALLPTVPVIAVIAVMMRHVMRSDELEQRIHMIALGIATAIVCVGSLVGGFSPRRT